MGLHIENYDFAVDLETARSLLCLAEQRIEHLNTISNNLLGFTVIAISAIWGFYFTQNIVNCSNFISSNATQIVNASNLVITPYMLLQFIILGGITSALVGLWRWVHHVYDHQIVRNYPEMIFYEDILKINPKFGITGFLNDHSPWTKKGTNENTIDWIDRIRIDIGNKRIGMRGKLRWTIYSSFLIIAFTFISLGIVFRLNYFPSNFTNNIYLTIIFFIIPYLLAWVEIISCFRTAQFDKTDTLKSVFIKELPPN